jgi:hypothetical protein
MQTAPVSAMCGHLRRIQGPKKRHKMHEPVGLAHQRDHRDT